MGSQLFELFKEFYIEHPYILTLSILFSLIGHVIETVLLPILLAEIFTNMNDSIKFRNYVYKFLIAAIIARLLSLVAHYMDGIIEPNLTAFLTYKFAASVFRKYYADHHSVEIALVMEKIRAVRIAFENFLSYVFSTLIPSIATLILASIRIFYISAVLSILVISCILVIGIAFYFLPIPRSTIQHKDTVSIYLEDIFQNIEFITSTEFGRMDSDIEISEMVDYLRSERLRYQNTMGRNQLTIVSLACLAYISNIFLLVKLFEHKKVDIKQFESSILTLGRMYEIVFNVAYYIPEFIGDVQNLHYLELFTSRLFSFQEKDAVIDNDIEDGKISIKDLTFGYNEYDKVYTNMSIEIESGISVALCGPSGCGKSTFTKLVLDIVQPDSGSIEIGGQNLRQLTRRLIRRSVASISQNTSSLLRTSIYKNITHGIPRSSELHDEVESLVDEHDLSRIFGYQGFLHYNVDKGGTSLSGGQRQIIHLMHAILNKNAKIYVLDEPSSALDTTTRECVFNLIRQLTSSGKTVLVITHDKDMRDICDSVIEFKKGENPVKVR